MPNIYLVIFDNFFYDQWKDAWNFQDFFRDEDQMAALFEKFIFNFYRRHASDDWPVLVEIIKWYAEAIEASSLVLA